MRKKAVLDPHLIEAHINTLAHEFYSLAEEAARIVQEGDCCDEELHDTIYMRMAEIVQELGVTGRQALIAEEPKLKKLFRDLNQFRKANTH